MVGLRDMPQFRIRGRETTLSGIWLHGRFSTARGVYARRGWIYRSEGLSIAVELRVLDCRSLRAVLEVRSEYERLLLHDTSVWPYFGELWTPFQVDLALEDADWVAAEYPIGLTSSGLARTRPDKELCSLCASRVLGERGERFGYRRVRDLAEPNNEGPWACRRCYRRYIAPKNLSFLLFRGWRPKLLPWPPQPDTR